MKLFKVAGVSRRTTGLTARFANSLDRARVLERAGHKDIALIELPAPMNKDTACQYLLSNNFDCGNAEIVLALQSEIDRLKPRGRKVETAV